MLERDELIEVVSPMETGEAGPAFHRWLDGHGLDRTAVSDDDIRIDTLRGPGGHTLRRYLPATGAS